MLPLALIRDTGVPPASTVEVFMAKGDRTTLDVLKVGICFEGLALFILLGALITRGGWARDATGFLPHGYSTSESQSSSSYAVRSLDATNVGTVSGRILYSGKPMPPKRFTVTSDNSICGNIKEVYPVNIEKGGIVDAVVWIDDITSGKEFDFPSPLIDQKKCSFVPHVLVMKPGELKMGNTDLCMHNVHIISFANREVNRALTPGAAAQGVTLARSDRVTVRCDVHKWMSAYVVVAKNPYYVVSGAGGQFRLEGVLPGHYHLKVWQETLGEKDQEITVEAAKNTEVTVTYLTGGL